MTPPPYEFADYLLIARHAAYETDTLLHLIESQGFAKRDELRKISELTARIIRMIDALIDSLAATNGKRRERALH